MRDLQRCIENLRGQLERHRRAGLREYPTRTIFIDPLLEALGWTIRDPDDVELEHPTIDGKSVDYALKVNRKPVLLVEAKALNDPLDDVRSITQVVGYAANEGVQWCVLTNGVRYKVYSSSERASAPEKLLFEVSIDPRDAQGLSTEQVGSLLGRLSREALAEGVLDQVGEEIFTTGKVRKALDRLFHDPPMPLVRLIRGTSADPRLTPAQVRNALGRIWQGSVPPVSPTPEAPQPSAPRKSPHPGRAGRDYPESHHTDGRPREVTELYRGLDRLCQDCAPGQVTRKYKAKYVTWSVGKNIFCCARLQQSGLRVWLKLDPREIPASAAFARDVSRVGHWGVGDVELAIDNSARLREAEALVRRSFERSVRP